MAPHPLTPENLEIRDNFDAIAPRYDLANRVISFGIDLHWRRVAVQALKQCHRSWAMEVELPVRLADLVTDRGETAGFVADPAGETVDLVPVGGGAFLVVGPEGGFTAAERDLLTMRGWRPVRLGRHLLRAETAAVVGAALLIARMERP